MIVGLLKEIKKDENRVALTPQGALELAKAGHEVLVEVGAGEGSGFPDSEYAAAGAKMLPTPALVASKAKLILKVKEPLSQEWPLFDKGHILFTYFHFASNRELTEGMLKAGPACIAYETVETQDGKFPLLAPMSEVAGKMAPLMASYFLAKQNGGRGILPASVSGTQPAKFTVLGSGIAGKAAADIANAIGATVTVITLNAEKEKSKFSQKIKVVESSPAAVESHAKECDVLIGAVYRSGSRAPVLISRSLLKQMKSGAVIVDIAIDQGGCVETSHPTTHSNPTFVEEGVIHYCVANMPGAYPRTSTLALTQATLPYALRLANGGLDSLVQDAAFLAGLNCFNGKLCNAGVAKAHSMTFVSPKEALGR